MSSRVLAGLLAAGCITAAAGGAYVAGRQNATAPVPVAAAPAAPVTEPAARPVAETEAVVGSPAPSQPAPAPAAVPSSPATEAPRAPAPKEPQAPRRSRGLPRARRRSGAILPRQRRAASATTAPSTAGSTAPSAPAATQTASPAPVAAQPVEPLQEQVRQAEVPATPRAPQLEEVVVPTSAVIGLAGVPWSRLVTRTAGSSAEAADLEHRADRQHPSQQTQQPGVDDGALGLHGGRSAARPGRQGPLRPGTSHRCSRPTAGSPGRRTSPSSPGHPLIRGDPYDRAHDGVPAHFVARASLARRRPRTRRPADREHGEVAVPQRFQEAIDEAAMRLGETSSDAYLEGWVRRTGRRGRYADRGGRPRRRRPRGAWSPERLAAYLDDLSEPLTPTDRVTPDRSGRR